MAGNLKPLIQKLIQMASIFELVKQIFSRPHALLCNCDNTKKWSQNCYPQHNQCLYERLCEERTIATDGLSAALVNHPQPCGGVPSHSEKNESLRRKLNPPIAIKNGSEQSASLAKRTQGSDLNQL